MVLAMGSTKDTTDGGILLPEAAREKDDWFDVVLVGPDVTTVVVGDRVLKPEVTILASKRGKDYDLEIDGKKCVVVEEDDIRVVHGAEEIDIGTPQARLEELCGGDRVPVCVTSCRKIVEFGDGAHAITLTFAEVAMLEPSAILDDSLGIAVEELKQQCK